MQRQPDERLGALVLRYQPQLRAVQQASAPDEDTLFTVIDERTSRMYASAYPYAELLAELTDDAEALDALATMRAYAELDPALTVILAGLVTPAGRIASVVAALNLQTEEKAARNCDLIFSLSCRERTTIDFKHEKRPTHSR